VKEFRGAWEAMRTAAGLPDLLVHDMRRSAVRRMVRRGITKHVARRISGHATDAIFDCYDITDEADLADAARKLETVEIGHKLGTQSGEEANEIVNR
jgi:integrase